MKSSIIKLSIIFLLILVACAAENLLKNDFADEVGDLVSLAQMAQTEGEMEQICNQITEHLGEKKNVIRWFIPIQDIESIELTIDRMRSYLKEGNLAESRITAGEILSYLKN